MKILDLLAVAAAVVCIRKLTTKSNSNLSGSNSVPQSLDVYGDGFPKFTYLEDSVQTVLLQCFPFDYTIPQVISDNELYTKAINAANRTGAPLAWVQLIAIRNSNIDLIESSEKMLNFCDDFIKKSGKTINLIDMRNQAIIAGLK